MTTAAVTHQNIQQIYNIAQECLTRCERTPYPSKERINRIMNARAELATISLRADTIRNEILLPANKAISDTAEQQQALQSTINNLSQELDTLRIDISKKETNYHSETSKIPNSAIAIERLRDDLEKSKNAYHSRQKTINEQLRQSHTENQALQNRLSNLHSEIQTKHQSLLIPSNTALEEIEQQISNKLTELGELETTIKNEGRISEELGQSTRADFESKSKDFESAMHLHQKQAGTTFAFMVIMAIIFGALIFFIFIKFLPEIPTTSTLAAIAALAFFGLGRIALLVLCGWTMKYLAELHRSHAEQSIIYRDRRAALGVAQNLLNASPELAQKQELLKTLAIGYLDFEKMPFGHTAQ
ncbi:hypothetical protein [Archangium primigenium]|uniref:hypothetical protein n=1 Tax=[Archangium] primigenium TaxID=2792470 RepID=UPI0019563541|nr:hypothetical protein [Archangium primigenium]MBM7115239.1 hypothetical protein [Archangium primigenium]